MYKVFSWTCRTKKFCWQKTKVQLKFRVLKYDLFESTELLYASKSFFLKIFSLFLKNVTKGTLGKPNLWVKLT